MLPVSICRHWDVEWLNATTCCCQSCGKVGQWFDGLVLWQRRPRPPLDAPHDARETPLPAGPELDGELDRETLALDEAH